MKWTKEDLDIFTLRYPVEGASSDLCNLLRRSKSNLIMKGHRLNLSVLSYWEDSEILILKEKYPIYGCNKEILKFFKKNRSLSSIKTKAYELKIKYSKWISNDKTKLITLYNKYKNSQELYSFFQDKSKESIDFQLNNLQLSSWTPERVKILEEYYPVNGYTKELQEKIGLSESSIKNRIFYLKLRYFGKHKSNTGQGDIYGHYYNVIKHSSKRRHLEFNISIEYIWNLYLKQDKKCALSGVEIFFASRARISDGNASLDRIDSSLGYIEGNVQWVHKDINLMKQDLPQNLFLKYCQLITNNIK